MVSVISRFLSEEACMEACVVRSESFESGSGEVTVLDDDGDER